MAAAAEGQEAGLRDGARADRTLGGARPALDHGGLERLRPRPPDPFESRRGQGRRRRALARDQRDVDGVVRRAGEEIAGAVEGIDEEEALGRPRVVTGLLGHDRDAGETLPQRRHDQVLGLEIRLARRRAVRLQGVRAGAAMIGPQDLPGRAGDLRQRLRDRLALRLRDGRRALHVASPGATPRGVPPSGDRPDASSPRSLTDRLRRAVRARRDLHARAGRPCRSDHLMREHDPTMSPGGQPFIRAGSRPGSPRPCARRAASRRRPC